MSLDLNVPSMALLVRKDLKLSSGKVAVQCSHAAVQCALKAKKSESRLFEKWINNGSRKICLEIEDLGALKLLMGKASGSGLITSLVKDAGHTEIPPGTITVLGIGPAPRTSIDLLIGDLKPY
tara:strand:+ start:280 stop:648 length:369 start_codon:yes stop_codon:yes gene_type:complete